jgi:hypothetical protein
VAEVSTSARSVRNRAFAIVAVCSFAASAAAQQKPADVTPAQIAEYKQLAEKGCREGGAKQGDAPAVVEAFCGCVIETLTKNMTDAEWRQVVAYSRNKQEREESEALAPHMKNLGTCQPQQQ